MEEPAPVAATAANRSVENFNCTIGSTFTSKCTKEDAEQHISFRVPPHKGGQTQKRKKNALEGGGKQNANKNTRKRAITAEDPSPSSNKIFVGPSQQSVQFNSNAIGTTAPVMTNNMMLFGDNSTQML
ncbi:hypothetical protein EJB05_10494 [Eragrostis curvula]|uniref:Uncharacterized protein n=1 Tax=Eragrostis curvula TaxID=38414 RepID=A0A5J9VNK8_9POAL|nr:hypothetical protein EJB05_10494 [Eragrostis curvula]